MLYTGVVLSRILVIVCNCCKFRFRLKYHPEEFNKRREETRTALQKRCEVFSRLLELNRVSAVSLDVTRTDDVVSLLDAGIAVVNNWSFLSPVSLVKSVIKYA